MREDISYSGDSLEEGRPPKVGIISAREVKRRERKQYEDEPR